MKQMTLNNAYYHRYVTYLRVTCPTYYFDHFFRVFPGSANIGPSPMYWVPLLDNGCRLSGEVPGYPRAGTGTTGYKTLRLARGLISGPATPINQFYLGSRYLYIGSLYLVDYLRTLLMSISSACPYLEPGNMLQ